MFCPNCGAENKDTAKFCANCGFSLVPTATPTNTPAAPSNLQMLPANPAQMLPQNIAQPTPAAPPPYYAAPPKARSTALILEILPGLIGFLGFGWMYAGETQRGVITLIGFLVWGFIAVILVAVTAGFGCFCVAPISWGILAYSAYQLNIYLKAHPDRFTA